MTGSGVTGARVLAPRSPTCLSSVLDVDFNNAAEFMGVETDITEAQYIVFFLSHTMLFCVGTLIEAHVVLTPTDCITGEGYRFEVFGGTHSFLQDSGVARNAEHLCTYLTQDNEPENCTDNGLSLVVLNRGFGVQMKQVKAEYTLNRLRYGNYIRPEDLAKMKDGVECEFHGWGSRRNGFLVPMLIRLRKVKLKMVPCVNDIFNNRYLCIEQLTCKDDMGSALVCNGYLQGVMVSKTIDRPCGVGFLNVAQFTKFITCGVDDSRDVIGTENFDKIGTVAPSRPSLLTIATESMPSTSRTTTTECDDCVQR